MIACYFFRARSRCLLIAVFVFLDPFWTISSFKSSTGQIMAPVQPPSLVKPLRSQHHIVVPSSMMLSHYRFLYPHWIWHDCTRHYRHRQMQLVGCASFDVCTFINIWVGISLLSGRIHTSMDVFVSTYCLIHLFNFVDENGGVILPEREVLVIYNMNVREFLPFVCSLNCIKANWKVKDEKFIPLGSLKWATFF